MQTVNKRQRKTEYRLNMEDCFISEMHTCIAQNATIVMRVMMNVPVKKGLLLEISVIWIYKMQLMFSKISIDELKSI